MQIIVDMVIQYGILKVMGVKCDNNNDPKEDKEMVVGLVAIVLALGILVRVL